MEVILQSHDKFDEIALFNLDTEGITIQSKADVEKLDSLTQGYFSIHDNSVVCFYRAGPSLYFKLDQTTIEFKDNDRVILDPLPDNTFNFLIRRNKEEIFSWEYKRSEIDPPLSALRYFSPWTSEEDFDIFLFIHNVINNDDRIPVFLRET